MNKNKFTKNDILQAVKSLVKQKGRNWLTRKEFVDETGISISQVLRYFDKWNDAVKEAGLSPLTQSGRPDAQKGYSEEELLKMIRDISSKLGKESLSLTEFCKSAGISYRPIHRVFGNWNTALQKAGLRRHPAHKLKIPDEELFDEYFRITDALSRFPSYHEFARRSKHSIGVYEHRFGNFTGFRKHAIQYGMDKGLIKPEIAQPTIENLQARTTQKERSYEAFKDRPVLGERIDFRGLSHAPVNELGVIYLFGILSDELGFVVESIVPDRFPDCEAKRKLRNNKWQTVRIEFEYKSSHFLEHRHEITKCDLIVCWEHDWNDCPLEIIPLKEYLETIRE